jgi:hypothetical protein
MTWSWVEFIVWLFYLLGMLSYWFKRAYYGINPPNPIARGYRDWLARCWAPLTIRAFLESCLFWVMFTPGIADKALAYLGWDSYEWVVIVVTKVPPIAAFFGHAVDSVADMALSKIPGLNAILPQMPGPLPQQAVVESQVVRQTTEVTQLQSTTTVVPKS